MKVALTYNIKKDYLPRGFENSTIDEFYSECDSLDTIHALRDALATKFEVVLVEADENAYEGFKAASPDFVFNFAEGLWGASRESQIPAMLEMLRIPYTGSDPLSLAICLDKFRTKEVLGFHGIATPRAFVARSPMTSAPNGFTFPSVVKPLAEGSSKGVRDTSFVRDQNAMEKEIARVIETTTGAAIIEEFLPGREFTVALLGNGSTLRCLPIIELRLDHLPEGANPLYSYEAKWVWPDPAELYACPAPVTEELHAAIEQTCRAAWLALGLRDWARMDVRLDGNGVPNIIEVNPIPAAFPIPTTTPPSP